MAAANVDLEELFAGSKFFAVHRGPDNAAAISSGIPGWFR
jgi:hypothetical protein